MQLEWQAVRDAWQQRQLSGSALYAFAGEQDEARSWQLNLKRMSGHRIGDFSHDEFYDGMLSAVDLVPQSDRLILEIHLLHKTRPFGAFYEDLLTRA